MGSSSFPNLVGSCHILRAFYTNVPILFAQTVSVAIGMGLRKPFITVFVD